MSERLFQFVVTHRWWVVISTLIGVLLAGGGMARLQFSNDYRMFFSPDNPQLQAFEQLQNTYTQNDNVLFVLAPADGRVFTRDSLAAVAELTRRAWQLPYSLRVDSITNFQHTSADGDDLRVEDLVPDAQTLSDDQLRRKQAIATADPLLVNRLISPDASVTGVNVTVQLPGRHLGEVPEVADAARALAA